MGKESKSQLYQHGSKRGFSLIRYAGLYDLKAIIDDTKAHLRKLRYDIDDKQHDEKISSSGKEMKIVFRCFKEITEYVKFYMEVTIIVVGQIDVIVDKRKVKKGNFDYRLMTRVEKNYSGSNRTPTFKKSKLGELQRHLYEKFIIKQELSDREDELLDQGQELLNMVRKHLL
ncbi:hypothetical protein HOF78_03435 [Candidatus Woesearchaeota archaeon]|jgi:hypothetical protein|nr:hypothetical protein [Candidatus Woesearchaeota archaeon]MBT6044514.1 hypothetical protein [Candidatus Woesearchaeota archaeon]